MTNQNVINFLNQVRKILLDDKSWLESTIQQINEAFDKAISALQAQDSKTRKNCDTCKHDPPSKKWPCMDCDMRDPADRWEPKECQTCKNYDDASEKCGECLELGIDNYEPKEIENSKKALDGIDTNDGGMISRQAAIDALDEIESEVADGDGFQYEKWRRYFCELSSAQPEPLTASIGYELSKDECDRLKQAMRDASIMLLPSAPNRCNTCRFVYYPKEANNNDQ